jgi:hypothetical protein
MKDALPGYSSAHGLGRGVSLLGFERYVEMVFESESAKSVLSLIMALAGNDTDRMHTRDIYWNCRKEKLDGEMKKQVRRGERCGSILWPKHRPTCMLLDEAIAKKGMNQCRKRSTLSGKWTLSGEEFVKILIQIRLLTAVDVSADTMIHSEAHQVKSEQHSRSKPRLYLLLNVLQCPVVPLLLAPHPVNLGSGEPLRLNCWIITWAMSVSYEVIEGRSTYLGRFSFPPLRSRLAWPLCRLLSCIL